MNHIAILEFKRNQGSSIAKKTLVSRATGSFYTHELIGKFINEQVFPFFKSITHKTITVVDPFAGDGRLVCWLIESAVREGVDVTWKVSLWDHSESALDEAKEQILAMQSRTGANIQLSIVCTNTFEFAQKHEGQFDVVVTNPPWEALKPDRRELEVLGEIDQDVYVRRMRLFDQKLAKAYPYSQPTVKFAGWGTNLSRVGLELSVKLLNHGGKLAVVLPSSTFADQVSAPLRKWAVENITIESVGHYPAEARLFENVDQGAMALIATRKPEATQCFSLHSYDTDSFDYSVQQFELSMAVWQASDFCIPFAIQRSAQAFLNSISTFSTWADLENSNCGFWAGRELDETGIKEKLGSAGKYRFVKGRMVGRFQFVEPATQRIAVKDMRVPRSADMRRIAWRDVSRPTQRRRMQATMIEPGFVTGNSLNIAFFENQNEQMALALLAVVNSFVFELQVRSRSSTSHISLGIVRGVRIPDIRNVNIAKRLGTITKQCLNDPGNLQLESDLEAAVAKEYGLTKDTFAALLPSFPKISNEDARKILNSAIW